jgi:hypothetical protein
MDRDQMEREITEYAERHGMTAEGLWLFVGDVTGSYLDTALDHEVFSRLTQSELELVHDVVTSHNSWDARRAS